MNIVLMGYMASGKSTIGKSLAETIKFNFLDLDIYIEEKEKKSIAAIFKENGELYFRKKESYYLDQLIKEADNLVLSTGGGTPCYGNNINTILLNENVVSIYLKSSVKNLSTRLFNQKESRPLIQHLKTYEEMVEFVGKHLFERHEFYNKAKFTLDTDEKSINEIVEAIILKLF